MDSLYSCSTDVLYSAGHLAPDGSIVILATLSHLDKCKAVFTVPGYAFDSADFLGDGKAGKKGNIELKRNSVALLRFTKDEKKGKTARPVFQ